MFSAGNNSPKRLSSAAMFDFAVVKILGAANKFSNEIQKNIAFADENERLYGVRFSINKSSVVLTNPVTDNADNPADLVPLSFILKKITSFQLQNNNADTYIIPLVERQLTPVVGTPREHATLLVIKNKECYFFDSCSDSFINFTGFMGLPTVSGSSVYSLEPLKDMLKNNGEFTLQETHYLGSQIDNINCGRYTADNAGKVASEVFGNKNIATLAYSLKNNTPNVDTLVAESNKISMDKLIANNNVIRSIRGMQILTEKEKLERIPTIKELLNNQKQTMVYPSREQGVDNSNLDLLPATGYYEQPRDNEIQNNVEVYLQPNYLNGVNHQSGRLDPELDLTGSKTFEMEAKENSLQNKSIEDNDLAIFDSETVIQIQLQNERLIKEVQQLKKLIITNEQTIYRLQVSDESNKKRLAELTNIQNELENQNKILKSETEKNLAAANVQVDRLQSQLIALKNNTQQTATEYKRIETLLAERNVEYKTLNDALITRNQDYNLLEAKANEAFIQASSVEMLSKQVIELQNTNTQLTTTVTNVEQERDAVYRALNQVVLAAPKKTPGWKFMLAGALLLLGLAAIGSGIGALLVLGFSTLTAGIILGSGGLTVLGSVFYSRSAHMSDQLEQSQFDQAIPAPAPRVIGPSVVNNNNIDSGVSVGKTHYGPLFKDAPLVPPPQNVVLAVKSGQKIK